MKNLATNADELYDLTKSEYQNTDYHYLPMIFASLFEKQKNAVVIAKGQTRNKLMHKMSTLRDMVENNMSGRIIYEPKYKYLGHTDNKSYIKFDTTGFKGGYQRICRMKDLKDILLYGFVPGNPEWEMIYEGAKTRTDKSGGRIFTHYG